MPLTEIQAEVLRCIAANRSPESYLAGATVLHRDVNSTRFSQNLDFFHDTENSVAISAVKDFETISTAGYECSWLLRTPTFFRAVVLIEGKQLKMEWAQDSAFRFFPVLEDKQCGYRLHYADAATNKLLAFAGRQEVRDYVDVLYLDKTYLTLGALAWAACGKDPGFTPEFLLESAARHVAYTQNDIDRLNLKESLDIVELKKEWLLTLEKARLLVKTLPSEEVGCLYLDEQDSPVNPDLKSAVFPGYKRHYGSVRGAWPTISSF